MNNPTGLAVRSRDRVFAALAMGSFLLSLTLGMFLPVYTDEIGWRFQERAAIDGGLDIMFNDLCGPNTLAMAPWFMMPVRWFSAVVNQIFADPLYVRVTGVVCVVAWALLLLVFTGCLEKDGRRRNLTRALAFGLLGMGVLPLLMVMSRPEQPLILTILLSILIALIKLPVGAPVSGAWLKVSVIVLLTLVAESFHLKGVLYAPVALICLAVCAKGRATVLPRVIGIVATLGFTVVSAHYWIDRFKCPGDAMLAAMLAKENMAALLTGSTPAPDALLQLIAGANPFNYVQLAMLSNNPMSAWLPVDRFSPTAVMAFNGGILTMWSAAAIMVFGSLGGFLRREGLKGLFAPRVLLALSLLACMLVWGASQLNRNVYEATHILPMLVVFGLLCLSLPHSPAALPDRALTLVSRLVVAVSIIVQGVVIGSLLMPLLAAAQAPGYIADQPYSVSIAHYEQVRKDIAKAMTGSGMPVHRRLNRVLIDDVTYLALQDSYLPLHRLGVLSVWNGSIADPVDYLRSRQSDGAVIGCRYLPANMRAAASRSGNVCALSRATLDRLAKRSAPLH